MEGIARQIIPLILDFFFRKRLDEARATLSHSDLLNSSHQVNNSWFNRVCAKPGEKGTLLSCLEWRLKTHCRTSLVVPSGRRLHGSNARVRVQSLH